MKLSEIQLDEVGVLSSWIQDLTYKNGDVIMTLLNGRSYRILSVPETIFNWWVKAPSKGKFWHSKIRGNYRVSRL